MRKIKILSALTVSLCLLFAGCADSSTTESGQPEDPASVRGAGKTALYLYMCGSSLETKQGAATKNIAEMLGTEIDENTFVVIQTGGAEKWRDYGISPDAITRYEIRDGVLNEKQRLENASMGAEQTLSDFIAYCVSEYPAEKSALILWDHGGGALGEVCYDENFGMDCLEPSELSGALSRQGAHFDLIGFDACLMATNETAATVRDYADYMLASEEIEPAEGWDYGAFVKNFSVGKSTEETGKAVCDAYMRKCSESVGGELATLSLLDLRQYESFFHTFEEFAAGLSEAANVQNGNFNIVRASEKASKFGAGSRDEGTSNLIDLYSFSNSLADRDSRALALTKAIEAFVPYKVGGAGRNGVGGVSLYFPQGYRPAEFEAYLGLCSSSAYKKYLSDIYNVNGSSGISISFSDMGSIEEKSGNFRVKLTEESRRYLKSVSFSLLSFYYNENAADHLELVCMGEDNDLDFDWDNLTFTSNFRGVWLALDGVYLNYSVIESSHENIIFSAPVNVNGKRSNLRFMFVWDDNYPGGGYYKIIGLWNGLDENNLADKQITPLKEGDKITILQKRIDPERDRTIEDAPLSEGETLTIGKDGGRIEELPLSDKNYYRYVFVAEDIFGNRFYSNTAYFNMLYTYDELLKDPLPDGKCAAEIIDIAWDSYWGPVG